MLENISSNGLYFTSDTHFGHKNIINFCNRPFESIEEHDQTLIDNWNNTISSTDTVFHLGDFCFAGSQRQTEILSQLNGHIYLIKGNHDSKMQQTVASKFEDVVDFAKIKIDGQRVVYLSHFPLLEFDHCNSKLYTNDSLNYALFGHVHLRKNNSGYDADRAKLLYPTQYDVGVDLNNYKPISWQEVEEKIKYQIENNVNVTYWYEEI